ncbi:hypothetical protein HMSSN139_11350 [Paenibacillus sp. HMSSN-139]|nr:hypothetical protein HMSSN139_11350 [Paenibacillus sp. HMSSN-139]
MEEALTAKVQGSELLEQETLPPGQRLYSPKLLSAWGDTAYEPISREDWLKDTRALDGISAPKAPFLCDISRSHRTASSRPHWCTMRRRSEERRPAEGPLLCSLFCTIIPYNQVAGQ